MITSNTHASNVKVKSAWTSTTSDYAIMKHPVTPNLKEDDKKVRRARLPGCGLSTA